MFVEDKGHDATVFDVVGGTVGEHGHFAVNAAVCAESEAPTCGTNAVIKLHFNLVKHGGPNLWLYHCMRPWQDLGTFGGKVK